MQRRGAFSQAFAPPLKRISLASSVAFRSRPAYCRSSAFWPGVVVTSSPRSRVVSNLVLAYAWFNLATAANGDYRANRDKIEQILTPTQRTEGQRLASNWKKGDILQCCWSLPAYWRHDELPLTSAPTGQAQPDTPTRSRYRE